MQPTITLISVEEAARRTGLATETIRHYYRNGKLTRYRVGERRVGLDPAEVEALIQLEVSQPAKVDADLLAPPEPVQLAPSQPVQTA